jgi:hypothetical protein
MRLIWIFAAAMLCNCALSVTYQSAVVDAGQDSGYRSVCSPNAGDCNPVDNTGCDGGQTCRFVSISDGGIAQTGCVPATSGTGTTGSTCTSREQCADGFICLSGLRQCRKLCCVGDDADCQNGIGGRALSRCALPPLSSLPSTLGICAQPCDWTRQDAFCEPNEYCEPTYGNVCFPGGTAGLGESCDNPDVQQDPARSCSRGLHCADGLCRRTCDTASPPAGCSCIHLAPHAPNIGVCA